VFFLPGARIRVKSYGYVRPVTDANYAIINYDLNCWWFYASMGLVDVDGGLKPAYVAAFFNTF